MHSQFTALNHVTDKQYYAVSTGSDEYSSLFEDAPHALFRVLPEILPAIGTFRCNGTAILLKTDIVKGDSLGVRVWARALCRLRNDPS